MELCGSQHILFDNLLSHPGPPARDWITGPCSVLGWPLPLAFTLVTLMTLVDLVTPVTLVAPVMLVDLVALVTLETWSLFTDIPIQVFMNRGLSTAGRRCYCPKRRTSGMAASCEKKGPGLFIWLWDSGLADPVRPRHSPHQQLWLAESRSGGSYLA